jgi:hypothetical protein
MELPLEASVFGKFLPLFFKMQEKFPVLVSKSAGVAQQVEQLICNQQVAGSSPIASSSIW